MATQNEQLILLAAKGIISEAPPEERKVFDSIKAEMDALIEKHDAIAVVAMQIAVLEHSINHP